MMTCYMCGQECEIYRKALRQSKDDIDRYLVVNSCKRGCPNWYDRDSACYEPKGASGKASFDCSAPDCLDCERNDECNYIGLFEEAGDVF